MRTLAVTCLMLLARVASAKSHAVPKPAAPDANHSPEQDEKTKRWLKTLRKHRLGRGMWIAPEEVAERAASMHCCLE